MAKKKAYFFKIELYDSSTNSELDYKLIPDILKRIVNTKAISDGTTKILDLTMVGELLHTTVDIFRYKYDHMFMRVSRQKPTHSMIARKYATHIPEGLLPGTNEADMGIEAYTYVYVNYERCILSVIAAQGAPNQKIFSDLFELYCNEYRVELVPIPNPYGIERIYGKKGAEISSVDLSIPVPDPVVLEKILGVEGKKLLNETTRNNIEVRVQLVSNVARGKLTNNVEESDRLIDCIKQKISIFKQASLRGKYAGTNIESYNFYEENFYFTVDINDSRIENGKKKYLNVDELLTIHQEKMASAYNSNKGYIVAAANREE